MVKVNDVNQDALVREVAEQLKQDKDVSLPNWAQFVKTGSNKERPPIQEDWWHSRAASILKRVNSHGPIGVSKLRTKYGSKKNRGVRPEKFRRSGGKVIRVILQQLETAGYVKKEDKAQHRGREIAPKGVSLLDKAAGKIYVKEEPKPKATPAPKVEEKKVKAEVKPEATSAPKVEEKKVEAEVKSETPKQEKEIKE